MALSETDVSSPPSGNAPMGWRSRKRALALAVWVAAFGAYWLGIGLPTDTTVAIAFLWAFTIAWGIERPWRDHLRFGRDWAPIVILLIVYDFSRGYADDLSAPHITAMIKADEFLFGDLPTVWLQQHFYHPDHAHWWDVAASLIYVSHFVLSLTIAVVFWLRNRPLWVKFMRRWIFLTAAGLATYFLYPAAPPWYASKYGGFIHEHVARFSLRGFSAIGLDLAGKYLDLGQRMSNHVAAMPSLHSGFALFAVAFFFPRVRRRWLPLLIAYPVAMALALAYTGEHYIVDAFAGWAYVGLTFLVVGLAERWWQRRREHAVAAEAEALLAAQKTPEGGAVS
jgi:hypothetical protein